MIHNPLPNSSAAKLLPSFHPIVHSFPSLLNHFFCIVSNLFDILNPGLHSRGISPESDRSNMAFDNEAIPLAADDDNADDNAENDRQVLNEAQQAYDNLRTRRRTAGASYITAREIRTKITAKEIKRIQAVEKVERLERQIHQEGLQVQLELDAERLIVLMVAHEVTELRNEMVALELATVPLEQAVRTATVQARDALALSVPAVQHLIQYHQQLIQIGTTRVTRWEQQLQEGTAELADVTDAREKLQRYRAALAGDHRNVVRINRRVAELARLLPPINDVNEMALDLEEMELQNIVEL